jgi:hypothetical protein
MVCRRALPRGLVERAERVAVARGVSEVARGPRGFLTAWKRGDLDTDWCHKREGFIERHMAQVRKRREPLWKNGEPTRRHLALVMWAYSPTPDKLIAWAKRRARLR